jgi:hypothetical protein
LGVDFSPVLIYVCRVFVHCPNCIILAPGVLAHTTGVVCTSSSRVGRVAKVVHQGGFQL